MADRSVRVRISADTSNFDRKLAGATAATETFNRRLDDGGKSIDRYSGRLGVLLDIALALAPALAPIGAELVPATAALSGNILSLGAGVGVVKLAFHGFSDALDAFNKASLQPTEANIQAAQLAMDKLPPSMQRLVLEVHRLGPEFRDLQRIAADGLVPGVRAGLRDLETDLPIVRRGIRGTSQELGTLARDTGDALSSRQWRPFLRFVGDEAPAALDTLGRAGGHTLHGLATLLMGFAPTTREIDQGILNLARDFDHWATVTERSKGFEDFLDYLRENGPRVLDLLGQTGKTFVDIGTAVAPLGGPTLDILTRLLEVVDGIASSDFGTPIFGAIVAWRLYARVAQIAGVQVDNSLKGIRSAPAQIESGVRGMAASTQAATSSMIADLRAMGAEYQREARTIQTSSRSLFPTGVGSAEFFNPAVTSSSKNVVDRETKRVGRLRSAYLSMLGQTSEAAQRTQARLATVAKSGAAVAGTAFVLSGYADKAGLAETSTLAFTGAMIGNAPGAVAGGMIGALLDAKSASDQAGASQRDLDRALRDSTSTLATYGQIAQQAAAERDALFAAGSNPLDHPGLALGNLFSNVTGQGSIFDQARNAANESLVSLSNVQTAFGSIFEGLNGPTTGKFGESLVLTTDQLQTAADRAQPAMLALGITTNDLAAAAARGDGSLGRMTDRIVGWINRADSAKGRTEAVATAFSNLSDESQTLDDRINAAKAALDALFSPKLNLNATRNSYLEGLRSLKDTLSNPADVGAARRAVESAQISYRNAVKAHGKNSAEAKLADDRLRAAQEKLASATKATSKAILGTSDAALKNQDAVRGIVTQMLSYIDAQIDAGKPAKDIIATYHQQRKALIDTATQLGINKHDLELYLKQLGFTPKAISTQVRLNGTTAASRDLDRLTHTRTVYVDVKTRFGHSDITTTGGHVLTGQADGGTIPGPRYPYGDKVLIAAAPGEQVISNRYGQADRFRADRAAGRIPAYADGGTVTYPTAAPVTYVRVNRASSSRTVEHVTVERVVERLPRRMRLAVDPDGLYAVIDQGAQANYQANHDYERRISGG